MKKIELKLALLVCLIAVLGLLDWFNNWAILSTTRVIHVPMAPLTAVLLILVSAVYASMFIKINHKLFLKTTTILAALGILIASFSLIDYFFIPNWDFENVFFSQLISEGITGEISPIAAVLLILANTSYLILKNQDKNGFLYFIKVSFYIQFVVSFLFIIAYVENFDKINENNIYYLAFSTAFCLFILSIIQLRYIDFQIWPFKYFSNKKATNKIVSTLLSIFLLYFLVYQYYNYHLNVVIDNQYAHPLFLFLGIVVFYFIIIKVSRNIDNELEETKLLYEGLFKNATVGLYQSTPNGKVLSANATLIEMLKYDSLEDLLKIDIKKGSYLDLKKRDEFINILIEFGEIKDFESEWITKNGETIIVNEGARAVKDENGIIIRFDGVVEDITIRKNNELALLKMNKAIDNSSDIIFMTDVNGTFTYINFEFTKLYQYTKEEVVGKTTPRILKSGKQSIEEYHQFWSNLTNKLNIKNFHFINKKKNGELVHIDVSVNPIIDEIGNTIGYIGIQRDITERIRNEQIQHIIVTISNASQSVNNVTEIMGLIQNELGKVVDTRNFYIAMYNEENDTIDRIFYEDEKDNILNFPAGKTVTGLVIKQGKSYLLKENETRKLAHENAIDIVGEISKVWLGVPLKIKGKTKGAFVIQSYDNENAYSLRDKEMLEIISNQISIAIERKYQEDQLKIAKEKAEESDRLKSAFLANMSHEIRTPMNSILGFSDMLMSKDVTEAKQEKYHEIINASGKRLMNLISDIVDISKIDAHELSLNPSVFNLNKLLDQLQQQFLISPKNKSTEIITIKAFNDSDSFINCDETRLSQVLSNLLENALKFTHKGSVEMGYALDENTLHFYVKDSGVGINTKDHQHIFERFGQADNEILKVKEGSGLGLAISKGIIELMGGNIWVESELLKGATFHFTIPNNIVTNPEPKSIQKPIEHTVKTSDKTILIAEDEESNFWYIEAALEDTNYNLIHVLNGKEAVAEIRKNNSIDLILMDFNMPIMNGIDATLEIRKTNSTIPIIALTAYALMADKEKALSIGCNDYLSKPVSKAILKETIGKYL